MAIKRDSALWQYMQSRGPERPAAASGDRSVDAKAQMAQIREQFDHRDDPAPIGPWAKAASVLVHFDVSELRSADGRALADQDMELFSALLETSILAHASGGRRLLPLEDRRRHLRALGTRSAMEECLASNRPTPDMPVQKAFEQIVKGPDAVFKILEREDQDEYEALADALLWVEDILDELPTRKEVLERLAKLRISAPLERLVGTHFAGRQDVLAELLDYFSSPNPSRNVFYLHGTGGTGKSTVLAKFALDLRRDGQVDQIVYLNFDRAALDVREPLTVLREIVSQLFDQTRSEELRELRKEIELYTRRFKGGRNVLESSFDGGGGWEDLVGLVGKAISDIEGTRPILLLIDTFESAQRLGESAVRELWRMFTTLATTTERLRCVAAGRVDSFRIFENTHELSGLEPIAVEKVLESICDQKLPADLVSDVFATTNGRPLGVVIAGHYLKRLGVSKLANPQARADALMDVHSEQAEAVLYNRVLGQITNPLVRRLSRIGLLLRYVTPGLIQHVLAPAIDMEMDEFEARGVFDAYHQEIDLTEPGTAAWGEPLLAHRSDVRNLMLEDLRAFDPDKVRKLDLLAIAFFEQKPGPMARAEEIYHRCFVEEDVKTVDARWEEGCGVYLQDMITEIPVGKRPWLANRLGVDLPKDAQAEADLADWETFAVRAAQSRLERNDISGALEIFEQRRERTAGSVLYALHADALSRSGEVAKARAMIDEGLAGAAETAKRGPAAEMYLIRSLIHERNREFAVAGRDAVRAYRIAEDLERKDLVLRAVSVLLRLHRKSQVIEGPKRDQLLVTANRILDEIGDNALLEQPGLMRTLAGELGPTRPDLLVQSLYSSGHEAIGVPSPDYREVEAEATRELVAGNLEEVADIMERVQEDNKTSLRDVTSILVSTAIERNVLNEVAGPLAKLLAAEVDQLIGAFPSPSMKKRSVNALWEKVKSLSLDF